MKKKKITGSVFFRLFLTIFCVMIPINIVLMVYASFVFSSVRRQALREREQVMQLYMSNLDSAVEQITSAFYRENTSHDMLLLMQSDVEHSQNSFEWYGSQSNIMNRYVRWTQDYPVFEGFFSYFTYEETGTESFAVRSAYPPAVKNINEEIITFVKGELEETEAAGDIYHGRAWTHLRIQEEDFLIRIWRTRNCCYGGWISLNHILNEWTEGMDPVVSYVFSDQNGRICSRVPERVESVYGNIYGNIYAGKEGQPSVTSENTGLTLTAFSDSGFFSEPVPPVVIILLVMALLALAAIPLLIDVTRRYILKPVHQLLDAMEEVRGGNLQYQIPMPDISGEFAILDQSFNTMIRQLHDTKIAAYESEMERQRIQMRYLSQQIQPHFVLNTLNILYSYEPEEYPLIQKMLLCLSRYFRYIVKVHSDFVELSQELEHIKNYFEIQIARYPDQFDYYVEAEEGMEDLLIPPLLIQNFTENSIKYAISMMKKVSIYVLVQFHGDGQMRIRIADTGKGLPEEVLESIEQFRKTHVYQNNLGIGIQNAIERLEIMYQGIPEILFYNSVSGGATVDIIMPCVRKNGEGEINI